MADKNRKTPPGPPGPLHKGPHGPWPSLFPPWDGHRPPPPGYPPRWNDTEPVIGVRPWENCCDGEDECVCVTSADVVRWDDTASTVVENSAAWGKTSADDSWKTSAGSWSSTYVTVEENSAFWSSAYQMIDSIDSGKLENLYDLVSKTSAFLKSYEGLKSVITDKDYIVGDGTSGSPLSLSKRVKTDLTDLNSLIASLYENSIIDTKKRKWVSDADLEEIVAWLNDHDKLFWEVKPGIEYKGRKPDGVFDQLEKIWKILQEHGGIIYQPGKWIQIDRDVISVSGMNPPRWDAVASIVEEHAEQWSSAFETASAALETAQKAVEKVDDLSEVVDNVSAKVEKIDQTLNSVIEELDATSGNWNSVYDTVYANSANWDFAYEAISDSAETWNQTSEIVANSGDHWNEAYDLSKQTAETVEGLVETVSDLSESAKLWNSAYHIVEDLNSSAELWNSTYETVSSTSAELVEAKDVVQENSAYWASGSKEEWVYVEEMNYDNFKEFSEKSKIFYNGYRSKDEELEPRDIWVKIRFQDLTYNPKEHQLAVGKASTRQDDYGNNDRGKAYKADWQLVNKTENEWMWGVTEGTNLNRAFTYGDYSGLGSSLFKCENFWKTMPEELKLEEGQNIYTEAQDWYDHGYGLPSEIEFTGKVEILDWDLTNATALNGFLGVNLWYDIPIYGKLPPITTKANEITYGLDRLFHITEMGDVTFTTNSTPSVINAFYTLTSLTKLPKITANKSLDASNAFRGCVNASKESIEAEYETLKSYEDTYGTEPHDKAFLHCGINIDPTALDNIPTSWGGNQQ